MSFSPFSFCWKIDNFQSKWRVARYKTTLKTLEIWILQRVFLRSVEFGFSPICFFFVPVFISCLFLGDEWHNYFTSVIDLYNRLLSKIGPFQSSGEFSITNSLKFGFSLFCRVLLLAFYFVPVFISCSFGLFRFFNSYLQLRSVELFSATDSKYH